MAIILVAKREDETLIYLNDSLSRNDLRTMREVHGFYCPDCGNKLLLKIGDIKIPHFAHQSLSACGASEPESSLHIQGKILLHQFFIDQKLPVEVEKYLPEIRQRPDLFINNETAIEFQCSAISASEVAKRSSAYSQQNLHYTWIAGSGEEKESSIQVVKLMDYQKEMLTGQDRSKYLLLLNPESRKFYYFSNLFHISGSRWVGKVMALPVKKQTFPFAVPKPLSAPDFEKLCAVFEAAKMSFIRSQLFAKNRYQNPFWLMCYKLGIDKHNFPSHIGVPVIGAECIAEHAVIWQLKLMRTFKLGRSVSDLIASGSIKLHRKDTIQQLEEVLSNYAAFLHDITVQDAEPHMQRELLYDIYCKSVRKLRK